MHAMWLRRTLALVALLGVIPLASASPLTAEDDEIKCERCYSRDDPEMIRAHVFGDGGFWASWEYMDCRPNSCHTNSQPGYCNEYHYQCPNAALLLEDMTKALAAGDAGRMHQMVESNESLVKYDAQTGTLAVLNCSRSVIGTLQVPESLRASIVG